MFDKVSQAAEKLATDMSRRSFVGSLGRWAGATALGLAGVLTAARAARVGGRYTCCGYWSNVYHSYCYACISGPGPCGGTACGYSYFFVGSRPVSNCHQCP